MVSGRSTLDELPEAIELPGQALRARRAVASRGGRGEQGDRRARRARRRARWPCRADARAAERTPSATIYCGPVRLSRVIRATAWGVVAAGVAAPLVRKRVKAPPLGDANGRVCGSVRPVRGGQALAHARCGDLHAADVGVSGRVQVSARRPDAQERRVHIDYPIAADRVLGLGELPTLRLQRALARRGPDRARNGARWIACSCGPTGRGSWCRTARSLYILVRHRARFSRAAVMTYAVFDIGAAVYWLLPTAPPWYAASAAGREVAERRSGATPSRTWSRRRSPDDGRVRRVSSGETAGGRSTVSSEATLWLRCPRCTSPHP